MRRSYAGQGKRKCRKLQSGKQFCMSEKAWSVFFATVTDRYGSGAEAKPMPKKKGK